MRVLHVDNVKHKIIRFNGESCGYVISIRDNEMNVAIDDDELATLLRSGEYDLEVIPVCKEDSEI